MVVRHFSKLLTMCLLDAATTPTLLSLFWRMQSGSQPKAPKSGSPRTQMLLLCRMGRGQTIQRTPWTRCVVTWAHSLSPFWQKQLETTHMHKLFVKPAYEEP